MKRFIIALVALVAAAAVFSSCNKEDVSYPCFASPDNLVTPMEDNLSVSVAYPYAQRFVPSDGKNKLAYDNPSDVTVTFGKGAASPIKFDCMTAKFFRLEGYCFGFAPSASGRVFDSDTATITYSRGGVTITKKVTITVGE